MLKHHYKNGRGILYCSNEACESRIDHPINQELEKIREKSEAKRKIAKDAEAGVKTSVPKTAAKKKVTIKKKVKKVAAEIKK